MSDLYNRVRSVCVFFNRHVKISLLLILGNRLKKCLGVKWSHICNSLKLFCKKNVCIFGAKTEKRRVKLCGYCEHLEYLEVYLSVSVSQKLYKKVKRKKIFLFTVILLFLMFMKLSGRPDRTCLTVLFSYRGSYFKIKMVGGKNSTLKLIGGFPVWTTSHCNKCYLRRKPLLPISNVVFPVGAANRLCVLQVYE